MKKEFQNKEKQKFNNAQKSSSLKNRKKEPFYPAEHSTNTFEPKNKNEAQKRKSK